MRFERPENTITDVKDLKVGDEVYFVIGIYPPFANDEPAVITGEAMPYSEYSDGLSDCDKEIFTFTQRGFDQYAFATDNNLVPGYSHNDNYVFRTSEDAAAAVEYLRAQWEARPDLIVEEKSRREEIYSWDSDTFYEYED